MDASTAPGASATCACGASDEADAEGRKAHGVDPEIKAANLTRLRRIEGQVRGLQRDRAHDQQVEGALQQIGLVAHRSPLD